MPSNVQDFNVQDFIVINALTLIKTICQEGCSLMSVSLLFLVQPPCLSSRWLLRIQIQTQSPSCESVHMSTCVCVQECECEYDTINKAFSQPLL